MKNSFPAVIPILLFVALTASMLKPASAFDVLDLLPAILSGLDERRESPNLFPAIQQPVRGTYTVAVHARADSPLRREHQGENTYLYTNQNSNIGISALDSELRIYVHGVGRENQPSFTTERVNINIRNKNQESIFLLKPGIYQDDTGQNTGSPQNVISVTADHVYNCGSNDGRVRILEIRFEMEELTRLRADVFETCGADSEIALSIDYDAAREIDLIDYSLSPDAFLFPYIPPLLSDGFKVVLIDSGANSPSGLFIRTLGSPQDSLRDFFNPGNFSIETIESGVTRNFDLIIGRGALEADPLQFEPLTEGSYPAMGGTFNGLLPKLMLEGLDLGCGQFDNNSIGAFNVYEANFNDSGVLTRFTADFVNLCEKRNRPVYGSIRYRGG